MRRCVSLRLPAVLLTLTALTACTPTGRSPEVAHAVNEYYFAHYAPARAIIEPLTAKTDEDFALNNARLASVALAEYDLRTAESALYRAYEVINSVGVNKGGRDIGAAVVAEKIKVWKGEPFERAMCNFYLGLVYYMKGDFANARGAFENALFKLRDYGEKGKTDKYREAESDFVIAYIMLGKSWQKLGENEKARECFARVAKLRPDLRYLADPGLQSQSNVLLVVDFGQGPAKVTQGDNSLIAFIPHPSQAFELPPAQVAVDGRAYDTRGIGAPPIDLLGLAQDRRWQDIDTIRVIKSVAGAGLMAAGAYEAGRSDNRSNQNAGLAMFAAGALLKASATADVRYWEMLPRTVYILPLRLAPGKHDITVSFGPTGLGQTWRGIVAPGQGEATYYIRIPRVNIPPQNWPPGGPPAPQAAANQ